jgi:hypothetical protein
MKLYNKNDLYVGYGYTFKSSKKNLVDYMRKTDARLFIKTDRGYKNILTGVSYPLLNEQVELGKKINDLPNTLSLRQIRNIATFIKNTPDFIEQEKKALGHQYEFDII